MASARAPAKCDATIAASDAQPRASSSMSAAHTAGARARPPSSAGIGAASTPSSARRARATAAERPACSCSEAAGAISLSTSWRTASTICRCSLGPPSDASAPLRSPYRSTRLRAMIVRWISFVPSPMIISGVSR